MVRQILLLQQTVLKHQADLGIALDGDGDRLLMVDELGVFDGDQLIALIANLWFEVGILQGNGIVGTFNVQSWVRTIFTKARSNFAPAHQWGSFCFRKKCAMKIAM